MPGLDEVRIGIIGAGAIGGALIERLLVGGGVRPGDIVACEPREARRQELASRFGVRMTAEAKDAAAAELVVLAAPPLEIPKVLAAIRASLAHKPLVVSFAGAVPLAFLEAALPGVPVVRVNPNSPTLVGAGFNPRSRGMPSDLAERFLKVLGQSPEVPDEQMNLYTALSAVGPTYFLPVFDAMIAAAMAGGLSRRAAVAAAVETARGTAAMVAARTEEPEALKLFTGLRPLADAEARALVAKAIADALSRMASVEAQVRASR